MRNAGSKLAGLVLAVAIIAILFSIARPNVSSARVFSDEDGAIATLRSIAHAQVKFAVFGAIDSDNDGIGEYGYLGELRGSAPLRVFDPLTGLPALDAAGLRVHPAPLRSRFSWPTRQGGEVEFESGGYRFKTYLPGPTYPANNVLGIPETGPNGIGGSTPGNFPDPDNCEKLWGCYAWPDQVQNGHHRVFFINQEGILLQTENIAGAPSTVVFYEGPGGGPAYDAALSDMLGDPSPNAFKGMGALLAAPQRNANDGNVWTVVGD